MYRIPLTTFQELKNLVNSVNGSIKFGKKLYNFSITTLKTIGIQRS